MNKVTFSILVICLFLVSGKQVEAGNFDKLVKYVSVKKNVPEWVLRKICVHESQSFHQGKRQAWPWVLNVKGKGIWFKDKVSALVVAKLEVAAGNKNVDIGLCQMNWRWHSHRVSGVAELINPVNNMLYAADYLSELKRGREWLEVIGAYHSPSNVKRAEKYARIVLAK